MSGRHPVLRALVMLGAAFQLLSPGVASIADGLLARDTASGPLTHIEATTAATCPIVHAPDCGVCRYLSGSSTLPRVGSSRVQPESASLPCGAEPFATAGASTSRPNGRAPPVL